MKYSDGEVISLVVLALFAMVFFGVIGYYKGYSSGYCDAKGGHAVTRSVCDVHGKVVSVP